MDIVAIDQVPDRAVFDDDTDSWVLHAADNGVVRATVVIATQPPPFRPWIPNLFDTSDFRGECFHSAAWGPHFHPAGKHVAVVGTDSWAGHRLSRLNETAASVRVFAHAPRRVTTDGTVWPVRAKRRLLRQSRPSQPVLTSAIEAVTPTGIRTADGREHPVDVIIYGTGFAVDGDAGLLGADGLALEQAWVDGMEPFFGVAVRGFPNYFFLSGPDTGAQARYIAECVAAMQRSGSSRIEVRGSSQQLFNERAQLGAAPPTVASAFDLSASAPDYEDTYDGAATLEIGGTSRPVRVRLTGHLDPLDGNYHWQGTVFDTLPDESLRQARTATLSVGQHSAPARIVEQTPWGTHSVAGVGTPPYAGSSH